MSLMINMCNNSLIPYKFTKTIGHLLHKWKCAIILLSVIIYVFVASWLYPSAGFGIAAFSAVPVAIVGLYAGPKGGFVSGLIFIFFNWSLFLILGSTISFTEYIRAGALAGSTMVTVVGTGVGYFAMLNRRLKQEIGERKQIQQELNGLNGKLEMQAQQALQARAQFLTAMSHKLRTPMNVSMGLSALLLDANPDMADRDYVNDILRSNREIVGIVDSILEYTKIASGDIELNLEKFQLRTLIEQIKDDLNERVVEQKVALHTIIAPTAPSYFFGDKKRLLLIIKNLLNNALDATEGGDEITLSFTPASINEKKAHRSLIIKIADTGRGIPPDKLATLFDPFSSAYESTTQAVNRAGIGAALCQSLCKKMNGEIQAESEVGKGTIITVTLPFNMPRTTVSAASRTTAVVATTVATTIGTATTGTVEHRRYSPNLASAQTDQQNPMTILLAEDNILNAKVALKMLEKLGHQVEWVEDGQQAVDAVAAKEYDLILMDIQMPRLDGTAATMQIRKDHGAQTLTIIALTADTTLESFSKQQAYGFDGFISKPISMKILRSALSTAAMPIQTVPFSI